MESAENSREGDKKRSTATNVFTWIAAIVINGAFGALIAWSATSNWIMGFAASSIYTVLIFYASFRLKHSQCGENNGNSVLTTVLFFLAVVAIGITTFIPVMNLIGNCAKPSLYIPFNTPTAMNTTGLSEKVVSWLMFSYFPTATFVYIPQTKTTVFIGNDGTSSTSASLLWAINTAEGYPKPISNSETMISPTSLISVSNGTSVCFTSQLSNDYSSGVIGCTDGKSLNTSLPISGLQWDIISEDDLLWFKVNSTKLYSVSPLKGLSLLELHDGVYQMENESDVDGDHDQCNKQSLFLGLLFLSFIPVLVSAVVLQTRHKIPSMPIAEYIALTFIIVAIVFIVKPTSSSSDVGDALRWWLPFSSLLWLLVNTFGCLTNRIDSSTLSWSSNFSGISFFVGMILLLQVPFGPGNADWWRWIVVTFAGFFPLILLSMILGTILLMVLGAIGILFDVWHLVSLLTENLSDSVRSPVSFLILAVSGCGLASFGILLNKKQDELTHIVQTWSKKNLSSWIKSQQEPVLQGNCPNKLDEIETGSNANIAVTGVVIS
jgi:hypothetical protein